MSQTNAVAQETKLPPKPENATLEGRNKILGFWLFLGGESVLFGSLFATFLTLRNEVSDGPAGYELFSLPITAIATFILLTSSLTSVLAVQAMHRHDRKGIQFWLLVTVLLGLSFLGIELYEFWEYSTHQEFGMGTSAFSSAFYTLVGFHGAHVVLGLVWMSLVIGQLSKKGLTPVTAPKVYISGLYWHFVDLVWVFVFTVVYLLGKVG